VAKDDDKPYTTTSTAQQDMERRLADDYKPDADITNRQMVNPNPFGEEDYAGTDPIYQNHATDSSKPLRAKKGPEKKLEDFARELHKLDEGEDVVLHDTGLGGKAVQADQSGGPAAERYLVPGQEGYPENPDKLTGPAVPASAVKDEDGGDETGDKSDENPPFPPQQPPATPAAPRTQDDENK
jgi:hypothetical protein